MGCYLINKAKRIFHFWFWVIREFIHSDALARAASLTLTSLLAMVPFLILMMTLASLFPEYQELGNNMQQFIFNNFAPQAGQTIGKYLDGLINQRVGLPIAAILVLFFISVLMIRSLDQAVNVLWQVEQKRPLMNAFLLYWAIITLGPIFFGIGLGLGSYLLSLKWLNIVTLKGTSKILLLLPVIFYYLTYVFLYYVIPSTKVKLSHACCGALTAVILFELSKYLFTLYVSIVPTYEIIYGTLVAVPLFILWVLIAWCIFLIGALVAKGLHLSQAYRANFNMPYFEIAILVLKYLYHNRVNAKKVTLNNLLCHIDHVNLADLRYVLYRLQKTHLIYSENNNYVLNCDFDHMTFSVLYQKLKFYLPFNLVLESQELDEKLGLDIKNAMDKPLEEILNLKTLR